MSQSDGEPAWQGQTYDASKDKKHLTGINKEGVLVVAENICLSAEFIFKLFHIVNNFSPLIKTSVSGIPQYLTSILSFSKVSVAPSSSAQALQAVI